MPNMYDPPTSDFLGDLTDELDGEHIVTFASAGPKKYAYKTNQTKKVCTVRGFNLNHVNSLQINSDVIKKHGHITRSFQES